MKSKKDTKKTDEINEDLEEPELFVERIRLEKIELRLVIGFLKLILNYNFWKEILNYNWAYFKMHYLFWWDSVRNLMSKMTIQEPTFDRMIVVYR